MDVPESMLYETTRVSPVTLVIEATGDQAARISTPGALISGYSTNSDIHS